MTLQRIQLHTAGLRIGIDLQLLEQPVYAGLSQTSENAHPATGHTKILAEGTHVAGDDPRTDHVAVIDHQTGLMWAVQSIGAPDSTDTGLQHAQCAERCAALRLLGHTDWRLPTRAELVGLIDDTRRNPAIDINLFPRVLPRWHWTSTPWIDPDGKASASDAWYVDFGLGGVDDYHRGVDGFALAVRRAGQ